MKECVLYDRECINCGECLHCDLDPEKICDNCNNTQNVGNEENILDFLNGLSAEQKRKILIHLSVEWAEKQGGNLNVGDKSNL